MNRLQCSAPVNEANSVISGGFHFTKTGQGTEILSGANSYTGATIVSNGTLRYDGSLAAGAGAVTVAEIGRAHV